VKRPAATLRCRPAIWLLGVGLSATPAAAQACIGTIDAPGGKVCGLSIEAPANTGRLLYSCRGILMRCHRCMERRRAADR